MSREKQTGDSRIRLPWGWLSGVVVLLAGVVWWTRPEKASVPKPMGQVRIALPDTTSKLVTTPCGSSVRIPEAANMEVRTLPEGEQGCWYDLAFPIYNARIHCTEVPVQGQYFELLKDAQSLVFGHESAAQGIRRHALDLPERTGMLYVLEGQVAAPLQFYVTDSTSHFLRGSLYFSHRPNADSTAPVLERMEADVRRLMETVVWP